MTTMHKPEIEEFAAALVRLVRDAAISASDANLMPQANSPIAKRWRNTGVKADTARTVIADTVDEVMFQLLDAIDNGRIRMKYLSQSGKEIDLTKDGLSELAGSYGASGGWCTKYSSQRTYDDCADQATLPH
jgi:hypothetical protein